MPQTSSERVCMSLCMLVGVGLFAYVVGSVCGVLANMDRETTQYALPVIIR